MPLNLCWACQHPREEHGVMRSIVNVDSNAEVCMLCNGWGEEPGDPRRGSPARHRFRRDEETPLD